MVRKNPLVFVLGLSVLFFVIFVGIAIGTVMSLGSGGRAQKAIFVRSNTVGVIELKGVIMDSKKALEQIESFEEDPTIKAVVVRINSPGGSVAPSQEIYDAVKRLAKKKPVYASMASLAASGGYYVACGAKKIFANPGTITGSIGVIMQFADLSKLFQWAKVSPYNIKTGKYKDVGAPHREMGPDEKAVLQDMIDNVLGQFRRAVASARGLSMEKVIEVSDGRIFSGEQAKEAKLVDELGGLSETIEAVALEAGIVGKPHVVYAGRKRHPLERIFGSLDDEEARISGGFNLSRLVQAVTAIAGGASEAAGSGSGSLIGPLFILPGAWR